jgi:hypothetical protein
MKQDLLTKIVKKINIKPVNNVNYAGGNAFSIDYEKVEEFLKILLEKHKK